MRTTAAGVNRNLLCAAGCLVVAISACGSTSKTSSTAQDSASAKPAPASDEVLATVEGQPITVSEVRKALGQNLSKLEEQAYELKKQQIDELIAQRLLAAEAARRGTTVDALVAAGDHGARGAGHGKRYRVVRSRKPQPDSG